jgi:hypothetical protein
MTVEQLRAILDTMPSCAIVTVEEGVILLNYNKPVENLPDPVYVTVEIRVKP